MTSPVTPESQTLIAQLRQRTADGTVSLDDYRLAIKLVREGRIAAATASAKALKGKKPKAQQKSTDELLGELGEL